MKKVLRYIHLWVGQMGVAHQKYGGLFFQIFLIPQKLRIL